MKVKNMLASLAIGTMVIFSACGPKDAEISTDVSTGLAQVAPGITASVDHGVVTLSGQVTDEAAKNSAENSAKSVKGVKSVVNNITVQPPQPVITVSPDDELRKGVTDATKDFPGVTVTVTDGEIVVVGELTAAKWRTLKQSLDGLSPRKVNTVGLTIKN